MTKHFWVILLLVAAFCAFFELGRMDVWSDNEGQRATPPAEMVRTGNYLIPTLNGEDYLAKPPLLYWMNAASYKISGEISPLTARIPTALCGVMLVLSVYFYGRKHMGEGPARWAAIAVLASPYILQRSRVAEIDIPLTLAAFWAIVLFRASCASRSRAGAFLTLILSGTALGAGLLLKGPPILIFLAAAWMAQSLAESDSSAWLAKGLKWTCAAFGLAALIWGLSLVAPASTSWIRFPVPLMLMGATWVVLTWVYGGTSRRKTLGLFLGVVTVGLVVAAPWAVGVVVRKGWPFITHLVHSEMLERTHTASSINGGSPFFYVIGLLGILAPWGLLLPMQFSKEHWRKSNCFSRINVLTGWLSVAIFSMIAGKEYEYVLPAIPFLLLGLGDLLSALSTDCLKGWIRRWGLIWRQGVLAICSLASVGLLIYLVISKQPSVLICEVGALTGAAIVLTAWAYRRPLKRMTHMAGIVVCFILAVLLNQSFHYLGKNSPRPLAETAGRLLRQGYDVQAVKMTTAFGVFPGFAFHSAALLPVTTDINEVKSKLLSDKPYFCILRQKHLALAAEDIPSNFLQPLMGPYGTKEMILIGNVPVPPL